MSEMVGKVVKVTTMFLSPVGWPAGYVDGKVIAVRNGKLGVTYRVRITYCAGRVCIGEPVST